MFTIDIMRIAKSWLIAEIETARCIVNEPYSLPLIKSLDDETLMRIANYDGKPSRPTKVLTAKEDGSIRQSFYIPWSDRLLMNAVIIANYNKIIEFITCLDVDGVVNYDRPLPLCADDCYLLGDYKDPYTQFKNRIIADENSGQIIVHTDIKNFAGSVNPMDLENNLFQSGWKPIHVEKAMSMISAWNDFGIQGIPQGYAFTDILLKMMMAPIDKAMTAAYPEVAYYRYVDDIQLSGDDKGDIAEAFGFLKAQLADFGFKINHDKTVFAAVGQIGIRHSFNSEVFMADFYQKAQNHDQSISYPEALKRAYHSYVLPRNGQKPDVPKYLVGYILREMAKNGVNDFAHDVIPLMETHPDRAEKILERIGEIKSNDNLPLNGLARYFFGAENLENELKDALRLGYLAVLKKNDFPISEYDRRVIASGLPVFFERVPFAHGYRNEPKLVFQDNLAEVIDENQHEEQMKRHRALSFFETRRP